MRKGRRSDCPISFALDIFGDRWSLLVVRDLMFREKSSYKEFLESEEGVATNILADRLRLLESAKIIRRTPDARDQRKDVYSLSEKGIDLIPIMIEIMLWSVKYDPKTGAPQGIVKQAREDKKGLIKRIRANLDRQNR